MTENDQAFDAFETPEPGAEALDCGVIDLAVEGKWGHRCGNETSQIKGFHESFLRCDVSRIVRGGVGVPIA